MWTNYHSHSDYCDGTGKLADYAAEAATRGMPAIGFSSHAPVPFACTWCMKKEDFPGYLQTIALLKSSYPALEMYAGLEVDYIPGKVSPEDFTGDLDYTIGSIHFVDAFPDGTPWEIDGAPAVFAAGLQTIFQNNIRQVIGRYFELTREMILKACPDVVGHLDKIKIQNVADKFYTETDSWYRSEVDQTLDVIARSGAIVEINTRGLYQKKSATPYPSPWIVEELFKRNIPVTLSSDAHRPADLSSEFSFAAKILLEAGYKKISILRQNTWQPVNLTTHGVILPIGDH